MNGLQLIFVIITSPAAAVPDNAPLDGDGDMYYESSEKVRDFLECLTKS